jgi:hypothetical protein
MQNLIVWQKWVDPFGDDDESVLSQSEPEFYDEEDNPIKGEETDSLDPKKFVKTKSVSVKVMATPMGIIPINENTASSKIFNFWVGHTNFNITRKIAQIIEETDGVEALDVFTRYRFRIAIGKVFTDSNVMKNINDNVYEYLG